MTCVLLSLALSWLWDELQPSVALMLAVVVQWMRNRQGNTRLPSPLGSDCAYGVALLLMSILAAIAVAA